ncbi:ribonuclease III [Ramicandelaber brevisporus]|nr:ribonuclease III [Ramicandelaber brevisporus]
MSTTAMRSLISRLQIRAVTTTTATTTVSTVSHLATRAYTTGVAQKQRVVPRHYKDKEDRPKFELQQPHRAFLDRLGLNFGDNTNTAWVLEQVFTHLSYDHGRQAHSKRLAWLGRKVLNAQATQHLASQYPQLSADVIKNIAEVHYRTHALGRAGSKLGMEPLVRWESIKPVTAATAAGAAGASASAVNMAPLGAAKVLGTAFEALIGAIYHHNGAKAANEFVAAHVLSSTPVDINSALSLQFPKRLVKVLFARKKLEEAEVRIVSEARDETTLEPKVVVALYSGSNMMGTGEGVTPQAAEKAACKDVVIRFFSKEIRDVPILNDVNAVIEEENSISYIVSA